MSKYLYRQTEGTFDCSMICVSSGYSTNKTRNNDDGVYFIWLAANNNTSYNTLYITSQSNIYAYNIVYRH